MQSCLLEQFVFAVSPVYLRAIEDDILAGLPALANADQQLKISTSQGYHGVLKRWVTLRLLVAGTTPEYGRFAKGCTLSHRLFPGY